MTSRKLIIPILIILVCAILVGVPPAAADTSHARIIRLSLVQGDVRFARGTHGDPTADSKARWGQAERNLPIRQGYVLATDNGRAEVEFENGAMAFLKENTVLEFYDLSLNDSARTTRLVLRQGSASFYVNPAGGDYFSVTGGDFTVEAEGRSTFRLDNYDDGSTVEAYKGRVSVLHNKNTTRLEKGQSLSVKAGNDSSVNVARLPDEDDFARWVSRHLDGCGAAIHRFAFLRSGIRRSVYLWRLFLLRGIWIRLAAVRRGAWLVTVHEWAMDLGSFFWLALGQLPAVGLGSLSLWRMALRYLLWWLVLFSAGLLRIPGVPCP